jgi:hypothetical protein
LETIRPLKFRLNEHSKLLKPNVFNDPNALISRSQPAVHASLIHGINDVNNWEVLLLGKENIGEYGNKRLLPHVLVLQGTTPKIPFKNLILTLTLILHYLTVMWTLMVSTCSSKTCDIRDHKPSLNMNSGLYLVIWFVFLDHTPPPPNDIWWLF